MPSRLPIPFRSAARLARALRNREISSAELLNLYWQRIERHDGAINAVIVRDVERARKAAAAADRRLDRGEPLGPLDGLPMTVKESFDWQGTPSTWGAPAYKDNIALESAEAVKRLEAGGAVIFGKTNVPLMLADWQSFNDIYGTTSNPWDLTRSPGGSSGGSAAALAAGLTGLELGSDIGASIRNPAHYCGVYGHKPTYGIVPLRGQRLPGWYSYSDISVGGPLARSAGDLALALGLLAGAEGEAARGWSYRLAPPRARHLEEFRVAVMLDAPESEVDGAVKDRLAALADFLSPRVKKLSMTARPAFSTAEAMDVYIGLLRAATSARQSDADFAANKQRAEALKDDPGYYAHMMRAYTMAHRDWLLLANRRNAMRLQWDEFFADWDVFLSPAAASPAFPHDHVGERHERTITVNGHEVPTTDQLFWAGYSCCFYLPATVAPAGLSPEGLPVGVQIVTAAHADLTAIAFARELERQFQGFVPPPDFV